MNNVKLSILVVDDHAIVRMGLTALLNSVDGFEVIGEAADGREAVELSKRLHPDIIILDILMPGTNGVEAAKLIRKATRRSRIVVLTTSTSARELNQIRDAGAKALVMKGASNEEFIQAIKTVSEGGTYISQEAQALIAANPKVVKLTDRQLEVLRHLSHGLTNAEIGKLCGVTANCVKIHISTIFKKLNAANRAELVKIAMREHLVEPN